MSIRLKIISAFFAYLFLNSFFFGVIFSGNKDIKLLRAGFLASVISQVICIYIVVLVTKDE